MAVTYNLKLIKGINQSNRPIKTTTKGHTHTKAVERQPAPGLASFRPIAYSRNCRQKLQHAAIPKCLCHKICTLAKSETFKVASLLACYELLWVKSKSKGCRNTNETTCNSQHNIHAKNSHSTMQMLIHLGTWQVKVNLKRRPCELDFPLASLGFVACRRLMCCFTLHCHAE